MQFLQTEHFGVRANETFDLSLGETTQALTLVEVHSPAMISTTPYPSQRHSSLAFGVLVEALRHRV